MRILELKANRPPIYVGKVVRIGPGTEGTATACFWRFWTEKSEIYAASRIGGHQSKISVHSSGEIHMAHGPRNKLTFFPLMPIGDGWSHAVELRFLLGHGAFIPLPAMTRLKKKNDRALLAHVPQGHILILELLIGESTELPVPISAADAGQIWRCRLKDDRCALLVGRVLPMLEHDAKQLRLIRTEVNPTLVFQGKLTEKNRPYVECHVPYWGPGGNVVFVVPMGKEGFRFEGDDPEPELLSRRLQLSYPDATIPISAPDGAVVGTLSIEGNACEAMVVKNKTVHALFGTATLSIDIEKLNFGEKFVRPTITVNSLPTIGGSRVRSWHYSVDARFDGQSLVVAIGGVSAGLRNRADFPVIDVLNDGEDLLVCAPEKTVYISADRTAPVVTVPLEGSIRLRDIH